MRGVANTTAEVRGVAMKPMMATKCVCVPLLPEGTCMDA